MGYKICYTGRKRIRGLWIVMLTGIALLWGWIHREILPRDPVIFQQLEAAAQRLEQGSDLMEAVLTFCQELMDGL